jgi:hypothetical protein
MCLQVKEINDETNYISVGQFLERLALSEIDSGHGWRVADTAPVTCADRLCEKCLHLAVIVRSA